MRGSRTPAIRSIQSETQQSFEALSRHRKSQICEATKTTLVKASQWARGGEVAAELSKPQRQSSQPSAAPERMTSLSRGFCHVIARTRVPERGPSFAFLKRSPMQRTRLVDRLGL